MKMDWVMRHHQLRVLYISRPGLFHAVVTQLSPDECLWGECSCPELLPQTPINARDIDRKPRFRQLKLDTYFVKR